ncbi:MAG TPA: hypothetical protein DDZ55_06265 [Firmicutes bacterium]|nr:hypothetical protein [Bacillota bacterium]
MDLKKLEPSLVLILLGVSFLLLLSVGFYSRFFFDTGSEKPAAPPLEVAALVDHSNDRAVLSEFRWNRDRQRSRFQETLEDMLRTAEGEQINKVQDELLLLTKRQTMENELENLLSVKGYTHNAVAVYPAAVTVIIKNETLTPSSAAEVGELVTRITGYRAEQVRIME